MIRHIEIDILYTSYNLTLILLSRLFLAYKKLWFCLPHKFKSLAKFDIHFHHSAN